MTNTSSTIIFFGTDDFSAPSLRALIKEGYSISAVVTKPDTKQGRGHVLTSPIVKQIAEEHGIPVWQPSSLKECVNDIKDASPSIGILVSYGKLIPQAIIDLFPLGIVNLHPSLLPLYRGPSPIEAALLNGDARTGISIMKLSSQMDAGPVYHQEHVELTGSETQASLYRDLSAKGSELLVEYLSAIVNQTLRPTAQDESKATYCTLLQKQDGVLDSSQTAIMLERKIRAFTIWPKTRMDFDGKTIIVTRGHIAAQRNTTLDIECRDAQFLVVDAIVSPNGKSMTAKEFLNGYKV